MEPLVKVWHGTWFQLLLSTMLLLSMLLGWTSDICYVKTLVTLLHHVANVWQDDHPKVSLHNLKPYMYHTCTIQLGMGRSRTALQWSCDIRRLCFSPWCYRNTIIYPLCKYVLDTRHQTNSSKTLATYFALQTMVNTGSVVQHIQVFARAELWQQLQAIDIFDCFCNMTALDVRNMTQAT